VTTIPVNLTRIVFCENKCSEGLSSDQYTNWLMDMFKTRFDLPLLIAILLFCLSQIAFMIYQTLQTWSPGFSWWLRSIPSMVVFLLGPYLSLVFLRGFLVNKWHLLIHIINLLILIPASIYGIHARYFGNYSDGGGGYVLAGVLLCEWFLVILYGIVTIIVYRKFKNPTHTSAKLLQ